MIPHMRENVCETHHIGNALMFYVQSETNAGEPKKDEPHAA
ncbi:hypothetical protein ROLI_025770 [Roseobacter fucihabitans]|uniref:Uncharacterized protein n=1 Tax=Roseobacter fucihabitans TaxID=1537242 RepID=A0ABZ2BWD6_9RHOB|nr:hypothetical protein [Roseobacter litoralis]